MFDIQLLKNNINTALEYYTKIEKKYREYYDYQENILGDKITIYFKDLCKTQEEKTNDILLNINNIVFFNEIEINIYYFNYNNLNNEIYIKYIITNRLIANNFYDKIYNVIYDINKIDKIETMYNNIDMVKQAILDLKISKEDIIDFIDINNNNLGLGPISVKKIKKYFEKYDFVDKQNASEISENMKWGYTTTYMVRNNIFYEIIKNNIIKKIRLTGVF
jgi:hypothetical protein